MDCASRTHAKIYFEDGLWHVRDFGLNGTRVDGVRVNGSLELRDGQRAENRRSGVEVRFGAQNAA